MIHDPDNEVANNLNLIVSHGLSQETSGHLLCVLDCAGPQMADVGALLPG